MTSAVRAQGASDGADDTGRQWRTSSRTYGGGNCVEVAARTGDHVNVRDSKNPQGAMLRFTPVQWNAFVAGLRSGSFGL
jgi:Domain of unknown function (DUF397)